MINSEQNVRAREKMLNQISLIVKYEHGEGVADTIVHEHVKRTASQYLVVFFFSLLAEYVWLYPCPCLCVSFESWDVLRVTGRSTRKSNEISLIQTEN